MIFIILETVSSEYLIYLLTHWKVAMMSIFDVDINDLFLWTITIFQNKHFHEKKSMFHIFANLFTIWAYKRKESVLVSALTFNPLYYHTSHSLCKTPLYIHERTGMLLTLSWYQISPLWEDKSQTKHTTS